MVSRLCFIYVIFWLVAVLVLSIFLRDTNHHMFYELRVCRGQYNQATRQLWQKQLELEQSINPSVILQGLESTESPQP